MPTENFLSEGHWRLDVIPLSMVFSWAGTTSNGWLIRKLSGSVCTMKAFTRQLDLRDPGIDLGVVEKNLHHQLEQMALAKQYGVHLALGTDAGCKGVHHGKSVVDELKLITSSGYSVTEAIQCATSTGARLLEIDETGNIAKGKPANFLAVRAAPAMLPGKLSCLEGIYLGGRPATQRSCGKM